MASTLGAGRACRSWTNATGLLALGSGHERLRCGTPDAILRPSRGRAGDHGRPGAGLGGARRRSSTTTGTSGGGPTSRTEQQVVPQPRVHLAAEERPAAGARHQPRAVRPHPDRRRVTRSARPSTPAASGRSCGAAVGTIVGTVVPAGSCSASTTGPSPRGSSDADDYRHGRGARVLPAAPRPEPDPVVDEVRALVEAGRVGPRHEPGRGPAAQASMSLRSLQRLFTEYVGIGPKWVVVAVPDPRRRGGRAQRRAGRLGGARGRAGLHRPGAPDPRLHLGGRARRPRRTSATPEPRRAQRGRTSSAVPLPATRVSTRVASCVAAQGQPPPQLLGHHLRPRAS